MSNGNPYYVKPATPDISPLLQGFGSFMQQRKERQRQDEATDAIQGAISSGNASQVAEIVTQYPEFRQQFRDAFGFANEQTEEIATDTYRRVLSDPDRGVEYLQEGADRVQQAGGNPVMMRRDVQMMQTNPQEALEKIRMGYASVDPTGYKSQFGGGASKRAFAPITLVKDGKKKLVAPTFDPETGKATLSPFEMGEGWEISKETPEEKRAADVLSKGEGKREEVKAKTQAQRRSKIIDQGYESADAIPNLKRGLELLSTVKTGGLNAANLRARQLFGIEGADEGELSNRLGKAVLSQLRSTFGAAFTAKEGEQLQRIEAGFGKSTEGNRRLLEQTLKILERKANRAIRAARAQGDMETVQEIEEAMAFSLSPEGTEETKAVAGPGGVAVQQTQIQEGSTATNPQTGERVIYQNGQWQPAP